MQQAKMNYDQILADKEKFDSRIWRWINFVRWAEIFNVTF